MIKAIENVKISSGYTTTIVNGRGKEFAKKVTLLNDVRLTRRKIVLLVLVTLVHNIFDLLRMFNQLKF